MIDYDDDNGKIAYDAIPDYTMGGLRRYIDQRIPPGGFLTAVLENDLRESFGRADENNRAALFYICAWLYNEAPAACWGSPAKVSAWLHPAEEVQS